MDEVLHLLYQVSYSLMYELETIDFATQCVEGESHGHESECFSHYKPKH